LESLTANATNIASKLWWLTPEEALEYMKNTENLVIIDTRDLETKPNWFIWWMEIPYNQIIERFSEIPEWRPVLLHCGWGWVAPKAYQTLLEANVELPELVYIAWTPLFDEYNSWVESNK
jgi:rhodanese-related sulfurtransferase